MITSLSKQYWWETSKEDYNVDKNESSPGKTFELLSLKFKKYVNINSGKSQGHLTDHLGKLCVWMALIPLNFTRLNTRNIMSVVFTLIKITFWASKWRPCQLSLSQKQELLRFSGDGQKFEKTWVLLSEEITFLLLGLKLSTELKNTPDRFATSIS